MLAVSESTDNNAPEIPEMEEHFTVEEIAKKWKTSTRTVQNLFHEEPGVLGVTGEMGKRKMLRIPASIVERVHRRMQNPPKPPQSQGSSSQLKGSKRA